MFDINDFDETLPAPFEWDLKRLSTSLVVAGRVADYSAKATRGLALSVTRSYREHITTLARLPPVEAWNRHIDLARAVAHIDEPKVRTAVEKRLAQVLESGSQHFGLVEEKDGGVHIREKLPLVYHLSAHVLPAHKAFTSYAETLEEDRRVLLHRYVLRDVAFKAVGVGSVGTFCAIGLLTAGAIANQGGTGVGSGAVRAGVQVPQVPQSWGKGGCRTTYDAGSHGYVSRLDARADRRATFLRQAAEGLAAGRYRDAVGGGATVLRLALRSYSSAGACPSWRPGYGVRIYRQRLHLRGGHHRICRGLRGPDREGLELLLGGYQGRPHRCGGASNEKKLVGRTIDSTDPSQRGRP